MQYHGSLTNKLVQPKTQFIGDRHSLKSAQAHFATPPLPSLSRWDGQS